MFRSFFSRRNLFRAGLTAGSAAAVSQFLADTASAADINIEPGATILFQGDSITDCGRDKKRNGANVARGFGTGYPLLIASRLMADHPKAVCHDRVDMGLPGVDQRHG